MHWTIIAAVGVAAVFGTWWLWWRLPKQQVDRLSIQISDPKARADVEDNFRKTISQLLGGAAVLIGAALAYLQFSQQQQASHQQFYQQQQASHDLLISNQVSKGFEQLGSDKIVVRLGGIYALEGVMNTSEQYHKPVLEALSAFVRDETRTEKGIGPPATDIQAALTVIGRRNAMLSGFVHAEPDLARANIPKADLSGADLIGADLSSTNLSGSNLSGADLTVAVLNSANLSGATLSTGFKEHITSRIGYVRERWPANLTSAILLNTDLRGADLRGVNLNVALSLTGANLTGADLTGATVSQEQLDKACGINVKLDPGLTLKPCR